MVVRGDSTLCLLLLMLLAAMVGARAAAEAAPAAAAPVFVLRVDGAIGPATAEQTRRALERAAAAGAQLVVLQLDTPGGLDTAMRSIIKDILASPVPVAAYVAPSGARAASAGTYILYAAHIAAMAPATNLGAATPVEIGMPGLGGGAPPQGAASSAERGHDAMSAKRVNDAAAYIRGLAQLRGRDGTWAEEAVRDAVSLPARDALARRVIDVVATDTKELLHRVDGLEVRLGDGRSVTLATAQAPVVQLEPGWRDRLLSVVSDPSLALVLMMIGIYGLLFEFMNPGFVAPGVIGGVCLLLAMWGLQMLPVNYAGLALILLGIALFVAEAFVPSFGVLGLGGVAALGFGALLLFDRDVPGLAIPLPVIGTVTLLSAAIVIGVASMAVRARRRPQVTGTARLVGVAGEVLEFGDGVGWALVEGERWQIRARDGLRAGQRVRVTRVDGLTLEVRPLASTPSLEGASP